MNKLAKLSAAFGAILTLSALLTAVPQIRNAAFRWVDVARASEVQDKLSKYDSLSALQLNYFDTNLELIKVLSDSSKATNSELVRYIVDSLRSELDSIKYQMFLIDSTAAAKLPKHR